MTHQVSQGDTLGGVLRARDYREPWSPIIRRSAEPLPRRATAACTIASMSPVRNTRC